MIRSLFRFLLVFAPFMALIAWGSAHLMDRIQGGWGQKDMTRRSDLVFHSIQEPLEQMLASDDLDGAKRLLNRISQSDLLHGILVCPVGKSEDGKPLPSVANDGLDPSLTCESVRDYGEQASIRIGKMTLSMRHFSLAPNSKVRAEVYIFGNASTWARRSENSKLYIIIFFVVLGLVVVTVSAAIAHWTISGPMQDLGVVLRDVVRFGNPIARLRRLEKTEFAPLIRDLLQVASEVQRLKSYSAMPGAGLWTPVRLRDYVQSHFERLPLCVIANREPFIHNLDKNGNLQIVRPASGLVTGVEPILRACNGVWIAHGSGSGDRQTVDANDCIRVPPESPEYTLRRVWLTEEEEKGYYYGFSNEGLWPLCHIAHQRPQFESADWEHYIQANRKFCESFAQQFQGKPALVLIQDYHFALLPRMIRDVSPESIILLFWHIPWPNPEAFGICPWRREIIESMLAADVLGFHTQFHCNNFIDTVDRFVESKINREFFSVQYQGRECRVRPFPISIDWLEGYHGPKLKAPSIRAAMGLPPDTILGLGVDRVDYTKGLLERVRGLRQFAERRPDLAKRFAFLQIGSPSRTRIPVYQKLNEDLAALVEATNAQFRESLGRDLIYLHLEHVNPEDLKPYYDQVDICLVSPLHDGMNLVAKEFVAARSNEDGVLILSHFAGASRELREALIINPYGPADIADKLIAACEMTPAEKRDRMRRLRATVRENNVYRWAYLQLRELHDVRQRALVGSEPAPWNS